LWERLQPKLVFAENVRQALDYVVRGEVDAGFVYTTDFATRASAVKEAFRPPEDTYRPVVYPVAVVAASKQRALAGAFIDALTSRDGQAALARLGFLAEVEKRFGYRLGGVALAGPRASWPLDMHLARALVADRFALLGDAAHGVHPIAGQGLNLGLRDVAALAEVVADAARLGLDVGSLAVLERYERWRRLDSALSAASFDALNRLFSSDSTLLRSARDFGLGLVERMPALKQFFVAEAAGLTGDVPRLLRGEKV
jgi:2-polyprenyl-6-methoxyphenol hydroxylase-like FAD-dependent oxidoreductase